MIVVDDRFDTRVEEAPVEDVDFLGVPGRRQLITRIQPPPARAAVRVTDVPGPLVGERVVWQSPRGWHFDLRATSDVQVHDDALVVDVVPEGEWYLWKLAGVPPRPVGLPARSVYLERPPAA